MTFLNGASSNEIDNVGHVGGIIVGIFAGLAYLEDIGRTNWI